MQSNPRDPSKPANPNPNASPLPSSPSPPPPAGSLVMFPNPLRGSHHRRARSELAFRIPDEFSDPMTSQCNTSSFDEIGSEDDLFSSFMDMQKIGCRLDGNGSRSDSGACQDPTSESGGSIGKEAATMMVKPKHKYSSSVDGSSTMTSAAMRGGEGGGLFGELMEAKKAMTAEQLAELAAVDPKRAKRILANRQSAARSKERKARYILELERKVQTLQSEATTLSAQLTLYQRDTKGLSAENAELKIRLQAMEQQAQLRDALNEALKQEVERLRIATGEIASPSESYSLGLQQQMSYNNSFFSFPHQQPTFNQSHSDFSNHQQEPLGRSLQGLDISKGSSIVKTENSSVSATESSSTCNQG